MRSAIKKTYILYRCKQKTTPKSTFIVYFGVALRLSRYLWAVKLPPQNSANARALGGRSTARKRPIGEGY
ncbi:hypothetical protein COD09_02450 [Bacillus cereus]|uniref:Uncharacterized protein n=1 Tax=Bacillus cereus TaxID=1396 RepID=A0A2C1E3D3_BACCE|nr:hypothetical protein COD09_02450 [Bacillus cereus]